MHLLRTTLLTLMWQSAQQSKVSPLRLSLQGTRQQFNQFRQYLAQATAKTVIYTTLLDVISAQLVPYVPNRAEPRVTKRRPKSSQDATTCSVLKAKLTAYYSFRQCHSPILLDS